MTEDTTAKTSPPRGLRHVELLAGLGLLVSLLLVVVHVRTHLVPTADSYCSLGDTFDCAAVAASPWSIFLGLPWAIWGSLGFISILIAAFQRSAWLVPLSAIAAVASVGLLGISLFSIGSICYLCEAVHLTSWVLFFFVWRGRSSLRGDLKDLNSLTSAIAPTAGLALAGVLFMPNYWGSFSYKAEAPYSTGVTDDGHPWIGSKNPDLIIHEFVDYGCPHCKIATARTLRLLGKNSGWRIIRRHQPRMRCRPETPSCIPMRHAMCAGEQGKFWRADRWLFSHVVGNKGTDIEKMAADLDLDVAKFKTCIEAPKTYKTADDESRVARKKRIIETPGYVIDDKKLKQNEITELFGKF